MGFQNIIKFLKSDAQNLNYRPFNLVFSLSLIETLTPWSVSEPSLQPSIKPPLLPLDPTPREPASPSVPTTTIQPPAIATTAEPPAEKQSSDSPEHLYANIQNSKPILDTQSANESKNKNHVPVILPPPRKNLSSPKRNGSTSASDIRIVSPLAVSTRSASGSPTAFVSSSKPSHPAIPLAIALRETCNAIFHGADAGKCVFKVSGEVVMSFPSNYMGTLGSSEPLSFKLSNIETVDRLLHNQQLLKK